VSEEATRGIYRLPDLSRDYGAPEPAMTGEIFELSHCKHHAAYVRSANDTVEQLGEGGASVLPTAIVGLEKALAFNLSKHVLHSIFWKNLSPEGGDRPVGLLGTAIEEHLGSFDNFRSRLGTVPTAVQRSGWAMPGFEPLSGRLISEQLPTSAGEQ
jgi:Fe-Mn family superoxide dismutase